MSVYNSAFRVGVFQTRRVLEGRVLCNRLNTERKRDRDSYTASNRVGATIDKAYRKRRFSALFSSLSSSARIREGYGK